MLPPMICLSCKLWCFVYGRGGGIVVQFRYTKVYVTNKGLIDMDYVRIKTLTGQFIMYTCPTAH